MSFLEKTTSRFAKLEAFVVFKVNVTQFRKLTFAERIDICKAVLTQ